MRKPRLTIQEFFYLLVSTIFVLYSLLEVTGVVHFIDGETKLQIIFCIICLMFIYLVLERPSINQIKRLLIDDKVKMMEILLKDLDEELRDIFEEDFKINLAFYRDATQHKTINIKEKSRFSHYYRMSLKRYPKAIALATSLPSKKYFWDNDFQINNVEKSIAEFVKNGGTNKRVFFLEHDDDVHDPEVKAILEFQKKRMGVKVYTVLISEVPESYRDHFFVVFEKSESQFAWLTRANHRGDVCDFKFTTNNALVNDLKKVFKSLTNLPSFQEYKY